VDIQYELEKLKIIKERSSLVQEKYNFEIPDYVLQEIVKDVIDKDRIRLFINLAVENNRITREEGEQLKNDFC